jgi:hypothetical protein
VGASVSGGSVVGGGSVVLGGSEGGRGRDGVGIGLLVVGLGELGEFGTFDSFGFFGFLVGGSVRGRVVLFSCLGRLAGVDCVESVGLPTSGSTGSSSRSGEVG